MESVSKAVKLYQLSRKVHKWVGLLLSLVFFCSAVTGLMLLYMTQLGLANSLESGVKAGVSQAIPIEKVVSITLTQGLPGVTSIDDIWRIELTPSANAYRVRFNNNQEVQIDMSTGKVLSTKPDYSSLLIAIHEGSYIGDWYKYGVVGAAGLSLVLLAFSGYYMAGYPIYKRIVTPRKNRGNDTKHNRSL